MHNSFLNTEFGFVPAWFCKSFSIVERILSLQHWKLQSTFIFCFENASDNDNPANDKLKKTRGVTGDSINSWSHRHYNPSVLPNKETWGKRIELNEESSMTKADEVDNRVPKSNSESCDQYGRCIFLNKGRERPFIGIWRVYKIRNSKWKPIIEVVMSEIMDVEKPTSEICFSFHYFLFSI